MLTRKTQYAWMALGGLICLFGLVLACKLRDGNRAIAQADKTSQPPLLKEDDAKLSSPPPAMLTKPKDAPYPPPLLQTMEPEKVLSSPKKNRTEPKASSEKMTNFPTPPFQMIEPKNVLPSQKNRSEPKATLEMPLPTEPPPLKASFQGFHEPTSSPSDPVLPASFAPNTPTPSEKKSAESLPPPTPLDKSKPTPKADKFGMIERNFEILDGPQSVKKDLPSKTEMKSKSPPEDVLSGTPKVEKISGTSLPPSWNAPLVSAAPAAEHETAKTQPGEPPLAPAPGPVQLYHVHGTETLQDIARRTLGSSERWSDLHKLNPTLKPEEPLHSGTTVRLPADACVQADDAEPVKPLPALRPKPAAPKAKSLPLTGTYQCSLDEKGQLTLPRAIRDQLNSSDTVLLSPGPDKCLWLTNQPHLERLGERLDQSRANEADVRVFKRLYFAQTEKLSVNGDGRVAIPERLGQFAGLHQEVVLVGIDDHFEVWDAARWRAYTQQKSGGRSAAMTEQE